MQKNKKRAIRIKFFDKLLEKVDENWSFVDEIKNDKKIVLIFKFRSLTTNMSTVLLLPCLSFITYCRPAKSERKKDSTKIRIKK